MNFGGRFCRLTLVCFLIGLLSSEFALAQETSAEVVVEKYARMRARPSVESATVYQFPAFARAQAFNFDGIYWLIKYKEFTGYIIDSSIEPSENAKAILRDRIAPEGASQAQGNQPRPQIRVRELPTNDEKVVLDDDLARDDNQKVYENIRENNRSEIDLKESGIVLGGSFGRALPMQPPRLSDNWLSGIHYSGFLGYRFNSVFEINSEYSANLFEVDEEVALAQLNEDNQDQELSETLQFNSIFVNLKFHLGGFRARVSPYVMIGGGLFQFKASEADFDYVESSPPEFLFLEDENVAGFNLAVGLKLRVAGPLYVYGEGRGLFGVTRDEGTFAVPLKGGIYLLL